MILYLDAHNQLNILVPVHFADRFTFCTKKIHDIALKKMLIYLNGEINKGLILITGKVLNIHFYLDVEFYVLYGYDSQNDRVCIKIIKGFVIKLVNCPILWKYKLYMDTAFQ